MSIVQAINFSQFCDAFQRAGRENNFSYEGKRILFDYLEELSDDAGKPYELDVIALCCGYSEDTIENIISNYDIDVSEADGDEDRIAEIVKDYISDHAVYVGETEGRLIYSVF